MCCLLSKLLSSELPGDDLFAQGELVPMAPKLNDINTVERMSEQGPSDRPLDFSDPLTIAAV